MYEIHNSFYLFSQESEIGNHMKFTQNCGYDFDNRKPSKSKEAVL